MWLKFSPTLPETSSSLSPSISSDNVQRKPFRRKQLIESSEYDDSDDINSDEDSVEGMVYNISKYGKSPNILCFLVQGLYHEKCRVNRSLVEYYQ